MEIKMASAGRPVTTPCCSKNVMTNGTTFSCGLELGHAGHHRTTPGWGVSYAWPQNEKPSALPIITPVEIAQALDKANSIYNEMYTFIRDRLEIAGSRYASQNGGKFVRYGHSFYFAKYHVAKDFAKEYALPEPSPFTTTINDDDLYRVYVLNYIEDNITA